MKNKKKELEKDLNHQEFRIILRLSGYTMSEFERFIHRSPGYFYHNVLRKEIPTRIINSLIEMIGEQDYFLNYNRVKKIMRDRYAPHPLEPSIPAPERIRKPRKLSPSKVARLEMQAALRNIPSEPKKQVENNPNNQLSTIPGKENFIMEEKKPVTQVIQEETQAMVTPPVVSPSSPIKKKRKYTKRKPTEKKISAKPEKNLSDIESSKPQKPIFQQIGFTENELFNNQP